MTQVIFDGTPATHVVVDSDSRVEATSPVHPPATIDVRLTNASGTSLLAPADRFTYDSALPTVTAVSPNQGPVLGGNWVTITGTNFVSVSAVTFGSDPAFSYTVVSPTEISAQAPPYGVWGTVDVQVRNNVGISSNAAPYTFLAAPTVTAVNPYEGPPTGGTIVDLRGTSFTPAMTVSFGGVPAVATTFISDTEVKAISPVHAAGTVDVDVSTIYGSGTAPGAFLYSAGPIPYVTGVSPSIGPLSGGTQVTISGLNFYEATAVTFGGQPATSFTVVNGTEILAVTPAASYAGTVKVAVTTPWGSSGPYTGSFTYEGTPQVTSLAPRTGPPAGGTQVIIRGRDFTGATRVTFGGTPAAHLSVYDTTEIIATAPAHAAGAVDIQVTTPVGTSAITTADRFTYVATPVVSGISPNQGDPSGGTVVTITGANFTGVTAVNFGYLSARSYKVISPTQITATSPGGPDWMVVDVRVTVQGVTSAITSADQFEYYPPGGSPMGGPGLSGLELTDSVAEAVAGGGVSALELSTTTCPGAPARSTGVAAVAPAQAMPPMAVAMVDQAFAAAAVEEQPLVLAQASGADANPADAWWMAFGQSDQGSDPLALS